MFTWIWVFLLCSWKIKTLFLKLEDQKLQFGGIARVRIDHCKSVFLFVLFCISVWLKNVKFNYAVSVISNEIRRINKTGFPQALEIIENLKNPPQKFHAWRNHGIWKDLNNHGKIMEFCEIIWQNNQ